MAKTGVLDSDPAVVDHLKDQLQKLVKSIVDEDDFRPETIDRAKETLNSLKARKVGGRAASNPSSPVSRLKEKAPSSPALGIPEEFRCPLSKELMRDPVVLSSGLTYDRPFIMQWLKEGNRTCPVSQQVLSPTDLSPNLLIREVISQWCKKEGIDPPEPVIYVNEEGITEADRQLFLSLVEQLSSEDLPEQKRAANELRQLTKSKFSFRVLFGAYADDAIPQLLSPLLNESGSVVQPDLQEDLITTFLNISIHDNNKKLVAETPQVIPVLLEALRHGTIATRTNAAAALFTLSALDSNKELIGRSGALLPLIHLLGENHPLAVKDAASAIFNLCIFHENRVRAVKEGVVEVILKKIMNGVLVDELLSILAMLSSNQKAIEEMGEPAAVSCLLNIMGESNCERSKENCIAILYTICFNDRTKWKLLREEEKSYGTISKLAKDGTARAKRKAAVILERLNRSVTLTHTA